MAHSRTFQAVLEKDTIALGWTIARLPFTPADVWSKMVRLRVRGEIAASAPSKSSQIGSFPFRTSLFPDSAHGGFYLLVNRAMQVGAGVTLGSTAHFRLEPDLDPREAELPDELDLLIDEAEQDEPGLRNWYNELSEYTRREIGKWILGVKSEDARIRRAQQMAERLLATRQAEEQLPPVIEAAFRAQPKARAGWARMTPTQRRNELMAVFYYQTPDARQRRVEKLVTLAVRHSSKPSPPLEEES